MMAGLRPQSAAKQACHSAARRAGLLVIEAEAFAALGIPEGASDELRGYLDYGAKLAPSRLAAARETVRRIREDAAERIGDAVVIAPVAPCGPFPRSRKPPANQAEFLAFANLTGLPALAFPCRRMKNGMPFALQTIAGPGREAALVAAIRELGRSL